MADNSFILIADDDKSDRFLIRHAIEEGNFPLQIEEVADGEELIQFLDNNCKETVPRFILLDLNMPRKSGFEVLEYMKENPETCPVPVIVLSTSSSPYDISRAKELGAKDYLIKPDDYKGYKEIVQKLNQYL